jgi:hypothetical protein
MITFVHNAAHFVPTPQVSQSPFDDGVVVVMDGMGEQYSAMANSMDSGETDYMHDLLLQVHFSDTNSSKCGPVGDVRHYTCGVNLARCARAAKAGVR